MEADEPTILKQPDRDVTIVNRGIALPQTNAMWEHPEKEQDHLDFLRKKKDRENGELLGKLISETRGGVPRIVQPQQVQEQRTATKNPRLAMMDPSNQIYNGSRSSDEEEKEEISMLTLRNPVQESNFGAKPTETWKPGALVSRKDSQIDSQGRPNEPLLGLGKRDSKAFDDGGDLADLFGSDDGADEDMGGAIIGRDRDPKDFLTRQKEKTEMEKKLMNK